MDRISHVLDIKGKVIHTIPAAATVFEAIDKMVALNVGSLVVLDDGEVAGIITERDYLQKVALRGRSSRSTEVREIMTTRVGFLGPADSIDRAMALMTELRQRHLLVRDGDRLLGLISTGDLVKHIVRDQRVHIGDLTDYICSKYPA